MAKKQKPWAGRFTEPTDPLIEEFTSSIGFDRKLARHDIAGSIAHAGMLAKQGIIAQEEAGAIIGGLAEIKTEIEEEKFKWRPELEDIHMNIESRLYEKIGDVAGKLHTARSRNDQVALDVRMFTKDAITEVVSALHDLRTSLVEKADSYADVAMPGYTH
ncbi:MAG: argininosuccinate lyase, partial [Nitrospinae bacterium]|nr:argininosuccinate lyase [Nitrospinota bacterium]